MEVLAQNSPYNSGETQLKYKGFPFFFKTQIEYLILEQKDRIKKQ